MNRRGGLTAFLIMAHHQPRHLARLVHALDCSWARSFVHIDRKVDVRPFHIALSRSSTVQLLDQRLRTKVHWGGFSQVQAALNLLHGATDSGVNFTRYVLLTGSDYPIKPLVEFPGRLAGDVEFIAVDRLVPTGGRSDEFPARNLNRFHFPDRPWLNPVTAPSMRLLSIADRWLAAIPRRMYSRFPLYHGSAYWALTGSCVRYILRFLQDNPDYSRYFRSTLSPDEVFFQSVVKHSPFAARISHDRTVTQSPPGRNRGIHYIDWSESTATSPRTLQLEDFPALLDSNALLARKFSEERSAPLLDRLDRTVLNL
jgi:hypothetical protein